MDEKQRNLLKEYIKKIILESDVLDIQSTDSTALAGELNKPANKGFPIGSQEKNQIETAIKKRDSKMSSFQADAQKNQITFEINQGSNNFYYVIRKTEDPIEKGQFKYILWYAPFKQREDIGKPGNVQRKESDRFDIHISPADLMSLVYNFVVKALLMN
jgi:hypothetical protein